MKWRDEVFLICMATITTLNIEKWLGEEVIIIFVAIGFAAVIASRIAEIIRSRSAKP